MSELYLFDERYRSRYGVIAGLDEAGRGPLAGPLVACAVVLPPDFDNSILNDSKKLTDNTRRKLKPVIEDAAMGVSLGIVSSSEIDRNRMSWAVRASFCRAISPLRETADLFLIDGNSVSELNAPSLFIVKGDSKSLSIAAASVIAKVTRDDVMIKAHDEFPEYGFHKHKGYGTAAHIKAIDKNGPSPIHRMSFAPLNRMFKTGQLTLFDLDVPNPGRVAEQRAIRHYGNLGFTLLEKNWRTSSGEIDIILRKDNLVVFAEVKSSTTGSGNLALQKIDKAKLGRIKEVALEWLAVNSHKGDSLIEACLVIPGSVLRIPVDFV